MPYTTDQIATQQDVVDTLKEDINWVKDVSYNFVGKGTFGHSWNGTRTAFWADWRTNNPNATFRGKPEGVTALAIDAEIVNSEYDDSGTTKIPSVIYNYWNWEMNSDDGYENGDWTSWISTKESTLTTEESTLATMQADPA